MSLAEPAPSRPSGPLGAKTSRTILLCCLPLLALLYGRALGTPLALDDYAQRAMIEGTSVPARAPLDLYNFVDDSNRAALVDRGDLPWWTEQGTRERFLRPLPSLLVWLDFKLFGYRPLWPHVLSLAWWVAACVGVHELLVRMLAPISALIGALAFGAMSCHVVPIAWLADRDVLIAEAFGLLAFAYHLRSRGRGSWREAIGGGGLWALTMLTGEYALSWGGYVLALELFGPTVPPRERLRSVGGFAVPAVAYVALHITLHCGAAGIGFYRDPVRDPIGYVTGAPASISALLSELWLGVDAAWLGRESAAHVVTWTAVGALFLLVTLVAVFRKRDPAERRTISVLLLGSTLSLLPLLAAEPKPRLLGVAAVGAAGVLGGLLGAALDGVRPVWLVTAVLAFVHFVRMPAIVRGFGTGMRSDAEEFDRRLQAVRRMLGSGAQTVIVVRASVLPSVLWTPCMFRAEPSLHWRVLSETFSEVDAVRTGDRELEVYRPDGFPLASAENGDPVRVRPMRPGDVLAVEGMQIEVVATNTEQLPTRIRYRFDRPLDDPSYLWIAERGDGYAPVQLPTAGYGVRLAL